MTRVVQVTNVYSGRTTIPQAVRKILGVKDGDRIVWYINDSGEVCIRKAG